MKRIGGLLVLACLIGPISATAQSGGGSDTLFPQQLSARVLMTYCASSSITDRGRQRQRYCAGFVSGVEESMRLLGAGPAQGGYPTLCAPANMTARHFQQAYIRYASRRDTNLDRPAVLVVAEALQAAFPCNGG